MLGKTAGGLYWMFRYLERSENIARLVDAGFRIALTRADPTQDDWMSVLETAGAMLAFSQKYQKADKQRVLDFLLADRDNPSSALSCFAQARSNGRLVRTALTREVWEALNECWLTLSEILTKPIDESELPEVLATIRRQNALVRGALHGTMLRNDAYNFCRLGTFVERADNTARILDVKYYVLLPQAIKVGSKFDNLQWETVLRSVSGQRAFQWLNGDDFNASSIANFLIFDKRMPRSLAFSCDEIVTELRNLEGEYAMQVKSRAVAEALQSDLDGKTIDTVIESGLHEFLVDFRFRTNDIAVQIGSDFRFGG